MRLAVIIGLLLSFVVLAKGALQSWQKVPIPTAPEIEGKKNSAAVADRQNSGFNPQVPALLPDLKEGYLFNEARLLSEDTEEEGKSTEDMPEETSSLVDMEKLTYVGSIIIGDVRRGLVSFSASESTSSAAARPRGRARPPRASRENKKFATLSEKETFYDFQVVQILPEKIVFSKGESKVAKPLYDPEKERIAAISVREPPQTPGQRAAIVPQTRRPVQPVPQPEPNQPDDQNINRTTSPATSTRVNPRTPTRRSIQRPQVIQRRRLPRQSP